MYFIGVDIGGTGIQAGIVNEKGQILYTKECKTDSDSGFDKVMNDINNLIRSLVKENNMEFKDIKSIGFGVPSFINKKGEVTCVNLGWDKVNFLSKLREIFPEVNTFAENDATVAAIAESKFGSMKDNPIAVMLTLGTGVGGGIIINGKPFVGAHGMGSEMGHAIIGENYFDCNCGNNGCFETFCSATAIISYAQKLINEGMTSCINDKCSYDISKINAKMVFDAYKENDAVANLVISRFKSYLAIGIAGLINTLDPDIISLGGGVSKSGELLLENLEEEIRKHILYKEEEFANIVLASLGNDAGIIGAAFLNRIY